MSTGGNGGSGAIAGNGGKSGSGGLGASGGVGASGGLGGVGVTGGSGGLGGAGGSVACVGLTQVAPVQLVEHPVPAMDQNPALAYSSDSHEQVSVAFARTPQQANGSTELHHATLVPWQDWPADGLIQPTFTTFLSPDLSNQFRAGQGNDDHIGLLVAHNIPGGSFLSFAPFADANSTFVGPTVTLIGADPGFVAHGPTNLHLVGTIQSGIVMLTVVVFDGVSFGSVTTTQVGCSAGPVVADAAPYQGGWLVAVSDAANGINGCSGVDPGPPTHIDIDFVGPDGIANNVTTFDTGGIVEALRAQPAPLGVDVVYKNASGGAVAPIEWFRVEPPSPNIIGPSVVTSPGAAPQPGFAAAALGDLTVVAWGNDPADNPPDVVLTVLDANGGHVTETSFEPSLLSGPLSLVGSPSENSVVVAFPTLNSGGGDLVVELARFDCVGAL